MDTHFITRQNIKKWSWYIIILGIVVLVVIILSVLIPNLAAPRVTAKVEDARLDTFEFFTTTQAGEAFLSYNISVALGIHNTNHQVSIRYRKPLVADFIFHDRRLQNVSVQKEGHKQGKGSTNVYKVQACGEIPSFLLGAAAAKDFKKQNATGLFKVDVRLSGRIAIIKKRTLSMNCQLNLQLAPPGPEIVVFHEVNCTHSQDDNTYF